MNLRIRDHGVYWFHRSLAAIGRIRAPSLPQIREDGFERILVVATTAIGDAVLCTPLIQSLKKAKPKCHIGFWVAAGSIHLFEKQPGIDVVLPYYGKYRRVNETLDLLKKEKFDLALVANANDPDVIPMIWWSGCQRIIRRPQRHTIYSFMIANPDMLSRSHTTGHAIERNLQFCDLLEIPRAEAKTHLDVKAEVQLKIEERLLGSCKPWWVIHPGASRSKKQWGASNYANLAQQILQKNSKGTVLLTGSPDEKEICDQVKLQIGNESRVQNLAGELKLNALGALFRNAQLLISGDTGPYHIAMAVDIPTVTLFAPWDIGSSSAINGPYFDKERHLVIETSQIGDPISTISVDRVFAATKKFL
jgi:ADP-heptose:LPS heptosyltransferase